MFSRDRADPWNSAPGDAEDCYCQNEHVLQDAYKQGRIQQESS